MNRMRVVVCLLVALAVVAGMLLAGCAAPSPTPSAKPASSPTSVAKPASSPAPSVKPAPSAAPATKPAQMPKALIFAGGTVGSAGYVIATGMSTIIQKYTGIKTITQPMASTPLIFVEIAAGRVDLGEQVEGNSYLAWHGEKEFAAGGPKQIRSLGTGFGNGYFWVTRPDTGVKTVKDLVGKKAAYISRVSPPVTAIFQLSLEYYGILDKVTGLERSSVESAGQALIEKRIDAMGGPLGSFAYDVKESTGIVFLPLEPEVAKLVQQKRPEVCASMDVFPAGYYGIPTEMTTIAGIKGLQVRPDMSDDVAYAICKAVYDHPDELKAMHASLGEYKLDRALRFGFAIPMHPGAIKYYKEKGMWTKEHEELQQKRLAEDKEIFAKKPK